MMTDRAGATDFVRMLRANFREYRRQHFDEKDNMFRSEGDAVVFLKEHGAANLLVPPFATKEQHDRIVAMIPTNQRHRHFGSMQSSQAIAQSVFGTIESFNCLPLLANVIEEDGRQAFSPASEKTTLHMEREIDFFGEPRPTSIDVWLEGPYRVAIECKLAEVEFGTCSRTRLKSDKAEHCDGDYAQQNSRTDRCALTAINVTYWNYLGDTFGWASDIDHRPCPLKSTYQLARNVLAACVKDGALDFDNSHALILYDQRNPTMALGGKGISSGALRMKPSGHLVHCGDCHGKHSSGNGRIIELSIG
jgi:Restriction Endonuclease associating with ARP